MKGTTKRLQRATGVFGATAAVFAAALLGGVAQAQSPTRNAITIYTGELAAPAAQQSANALMQEARTRGSVRVIIGLDTVMQDEDGLSVAQQVNQGLVLQSAQNGVAQRSAIPAAGVVKFETVPFMSAFVTPAQLQALLNDPAVTSIREDVPDRATLSESVPLIKANKVWKEGFTGEGWVVAILDTGSEDVHPMLRGKLVAGMCRSTTNGSFSSHSVCPGGVASSNALKSGRPCTAEGCYHGTHVASTAVGNTRALRGVARGADYISAQVFSRFDPGTSNCPGSQPCALSFNTDQISAMERVYKLRKQFKIASINMSLGGGSFTSHCDAGDPARSAIINKLTRQKIAVAIAAGNNGFNGSISSPACITNAVAVGSTTKADDISSFSNHSDLVDIMAPGSNINAAMPGKTYGVLSGTSMATPHIAGSFALMRDAFPDAKVKDILRAMQKTGVPVSRAGVTKSRVDLRRTLTRLQNTLP